MEKINRLIFLFLLAAIVCAVGCVAPKPTPDPLVGWRVLYKGYEHLDKITTDCHAYINNLPQELKVGVGPIEYLEDGTGQHAVRIEIAKDGVDWAHVLIYDKNDMRIKVLKYVSGYYRS